MSGIADVSDLIFTPIPQLLLGVRVESLRMWKREAGPGGEILEKAVDTPTECWREEDLLCHYSRPQQRQCLRTKK